MKAKKAKAELNAGVEWNTQPYAELNSANLPRTPQYVEYKDPPWSSSDLRTSSRYQLHQVLHSWRPAHHGIAQKYTRF
jgi:hypothetical protein